MLPMDAVLPLVLFVALLLMLSLLALTASGHVPAEHRAPALASGSGTVILYGSMAIALLCLLAGFIVAWRLIPWYAAVIGGGIAILMAPLVLQQFSDRFVDGRRSLAIFAGASMVLALLLRWVARS
jgi:hypothetical protein